MGAVRVLMTVAVVTFSGVAAIGVQATPDKPPKWMLVLVLGAMTFIVGPFWHLRTARILTCGTQERVP